MAKSTATIHDTLAAAKAAIEALDENKKISVATFKEGALQKVLVAEAEAVTSYTLEIVVANGTSEKEVDLPRNLLETELYLEAPNLSQGSHQCTLEQLTSRQNVIYTLADQVSDNDEGTSTGVAETIITDSGKAWTPSDYVDKYLMVYDGTAKGEKRRITANDGTTITCAGATFVTWGMSIGDKYTICESFAVHLQRALDNPTMKIICDTNTNRDETFYLEVVGL